VNGAQTRFCLWTFFKIANFARQPFEVISFAACIHFLATEWPCIGNQIDAAFITAPAYVRTVREVRSDQPNFLDQPFLLEGTIEVSNYYNWGYREAEQTHYSFKVIDGTGNDCAVFGECAKAAELRQQSFDNSGPLNGVFTVVLLSDRYRASSSELLLELLDYHLEK
jgi:hypothetical protein